MEDYFILEQNVFSERALNNFTHTVYSIGKADEEGKICTA
jgi:hypothetical protein